MPTVEVLAWAVEYKKGEHDGQYQLFCVNSR